MARPRSDHPTELELEILKVLWRESPQTVAQVREALAAVPASRELTHSSVITVMNIMVRKRYLKRKKRGRAYEYEPQIAGKDVGRDMLGDLVSRVFEGSAAAVRLISSSTSTICPFSMPSIGSRVTFQPPRPDPPRQCDPGKRPCNCRRETTVPLPVCGGTCATHAVFPPI